MNAGTSVLSPVTTQSRKTTIIVLLLSSIILSERLPRRSLHFTTKSTSSPPSRVFLTSVLRAAMALSGSDNQDWEGAVSGWAEVALKKCLLFSMVFLQLVVLWLHLSSSDTFGYTSLVLTIRSALSLVNCTLMLRWLITAIFGTTNLLDALLQACGILYHIAGSVRSTSTASLLCVQRNDSKVRVFN